MKVKMFAKSGSHIGKSARMSVMTATLEEDVNSWLEENPDIKVTTITQSSTGGSMDTSKHLISIWYE